MTALPLLGFAVAAAVYVLESIATPSVRWPDAEQYGAMARNVRTPAPYWRRWLLPLLCGDEEPWWRFVHAVSIGALGGLLTLATRDWRAAWLMAILPAFSWVHAKCPMLVDLPAMALATAAALAWRQGDHAVALGFAVLAGACKESGPVFAAMFAGSPWLLVGLVGARWHGAAEPPVTQIELSHERETARFEVGMVVNDNKLVTDVDRGGDMLTVIDPWIQRSPLALFRHAMKHKRPDWREPLLMVKAWGAVPVLFALGARWDMLTLTACLAFCVAFGQCLIAYDRTRLIQWAAAPIICVAMRAPEWALTIGCAVQLLTPRCV